MKRSTIRWRIFKSGLVIILIILCLTAVLFNVAVRIWLERDVVHQLRLIAIRAEDTALRHGPDLVKEPGGHLPPPPPTLSEQMNGGDNTTLRFYFLLDRSLRDPLSVLNADYLLFDSDGKPIASVNEEMQASQNQVREIVLKAISSRLSGIEGDELVLHVEGTREVAIARRVSSRNSFGLGWIVTYSSTQKLMELQMAVNGILLLLLILSSLLAAVVSSRAARTISAPFSQLNLHLGSLADRKFGAHLQLPVDDELQEFVTRINLLSEKLETDDAAQKVFLQNASHEFRTPLMSIRSYAEGIRHGIVEPDQGVSVILEETARMTLLVNDLLYLSRLEAMDGASPAEQVVLSELVDQCRDRMAIIAMERGIRLETNNPDEIVRVVGDAGQLGRALDNLVDNCIRHAASSVWVRLFFNKPESQAGADSSLEMQGEVPATEGREGIGAACLLVVEDDGPGFSEADLPHLFERFYKGRNGHFGLGLAIVRQVAERHGGYVVALNTSHGARFELWLPKA